MSVANSLCAKPCGSRNRRGTEVEDGIGTKSFAPCTSDSWSYHSPPPLGCWGPVEWSASASLCFLPLRGYLYCFDSFTQGIVLFSVPYEVGNVLYMVQLYFGCCAYSSLPDVSHQYWIPAVIGQQNWYCFAHVYMFSDFVSLMRNCQHKVLNAIKMYLLFVKMQNFTNCDSKNFSLFITSVTWQWTTALSISQ